MRLRLHIAYDGTEYCGWQIQKEDRTVEGELTGALTEICDVPAGEIKVTGASRTDSGVHALGQVAHVDLPVERGDWELIAGLNGLTDRDLCVTRLERAADDFHARYDAAGKWYRYDIWNHRFPHPLRDHRTWHRYDDLDLKRMRAAADLLVGTHDFAAFRASDGQSPTTERTMRRVDIQVPEARTGEAEGMLVRIHVEGEAFLKYMVRVMAGTLLEVANGRFSVDRVQMALETGDREAAGITAPGCGLTLVEVRYPGSPWSEPPPHIGGPYVPGEASA